MVDHTPNNPTNDTNAPAPQETKPPETLGRSADAPAPSLVAEFIAECCETVTPAEGAAEVRAARYDDVYVEYVRFCGTRNAAPVGRHRFSAEARPLVPAWRDLDPSQGLPRERAANGLTYRMVPGLVLRGSQPSTLRMGPMARLEMMHAEAMRLAGKLAAAKEAILEEVFFGTSQRHDAVEWLKDSVHRQCVGRCGGTECVEDDGLCSGWCVEEGLAVLRVPASDMVTADVYALMDVLYDTSKYSDAATDAVCAKGVSK